MQYNGIEITHIAVMRTWNEDPNEAGVGRYGNISLDGYDASSLEDWIDLADAVRAAWGAPEETAYIVLQSDGKWVELTDTSNIAGH